MLITGRDIQVQEAYRDEMQRQAEPWHILKIQGRLALWTRNAYRATMLQIGQQLETLGCRLKSRYSSQSMENALYATSEG